MLSKSNYISGLQCSKLLWYNIHSYGERSEPDASTQNRFDEGNLIGEYARTLYPKGIECYHHGMHTDENIRLTKDALNKKKPLYEAGIKFGELYARADILVPSKGGWDIVEVKSSGSIEPKHELDISFQYYIFTNAGLKINKCYILHINKEYVRSGKLNIKKLLKLEEVEINTDGIAEEAKKMLEVIKLQKPPVVDIGKHCNDPYECGFIHLCWKHIPTPSVLDVSWVGWKLYYDGIIKIQDIPANYPLKDKQAIQVKSIKSGKPHIDKKVIKTFLDQLTYPLYYFDFETAAPVVPLYSKNKPRQQIPFQYSLHVDNGKKVEHYSYLCLEKKDPRPELLENLKKQIGPKGSIIAYKKSFEIGRLKEMALAYPKYKKFIESLIPRVVDLLDVFANFDVYYPSQAGTASIKAVMPALTGISYDDMEIANGSDATLTYLAVMKGLKEEADVRANLEKYCCQDTYGMVKIIEKLREMQNGK